MKNSIMKTLAAACMLAGLVAYQAKAGNDKDLKNTPTHQVTVTEVTALAEVPRELRDKSTQNVANTLAINNFAFENAKNGGYSLNFALVKSGTTFVRIVNADGYDVYFETYKGGNTYTKQLDLATLGTGTYYLQLTQNGKTYTKKLVFS